MIKLTISSWKGCGNCMSEVMDDVLLEGRPTGAAIAFWDTNEGGSTIWKILDNSDESAFRIR